MSKESTIRAAVTSALGIRGATIYTHATKYPFAPDLSRVRLNNPTARQRIVLEAAYRVAQGDSIANLNWSDVANECEITTSISTAKRAYDFSIVQLRKQVANLAYHRRNYTLVAEAKRLGFID